MVEPRILVTHVIPQPAIDLLSEVGHVEVYSGPHRTFSKIELIEALKRNDCLYCSLMNAIDSEVLNANPCLRIVANMAVGYDNIDVPAATARRIPVTNTPGVLTQTTADLTWALLLAVARRIVEADGYTRAGKFKGPTLNLMLGTDVFGKTLGIVGLGRIGRAVARRARGFEMKVLYHNRRRLDRVREVELGVEYVGLDTLLRSSDYVSLHTPLSPETHHLIGERQLALMKASAFLINTSRGQVVDEKALVRALLEKRLAGAGLDVYEREPEIEPELMSLPNVVLLPHIGSASVETRTKMAITAAENVLAAIRGERPPNLVNPEVYGVRRVADSPLPRIEKGLFH